MVWWLRSSNNSNNAREVNNNGNLNSNNNVNNTNAVAPGFLRAKQIMMPWVRHALLSSHVRVIAISAGIRQRNGNG